MLIRMNNIARHYTMGKVTVAALDGVSLEIEKESYTSIMGPSGSGKSTMLHLLGCLDSPTAGTYELDGIAVDRMNHNQLAEIRNAKIGFVFQTFNLLPNLSIVDNVELPLIYSGVSKKNRKKLAEEALDRVGLQHRLRHKPAELSGGERQRTAIARALINKPAIILADEPTGNLDSAAGSSIMNIFNELHSQGNTLILVTHDASIAKMTEQVIRLRDGRRDNS